MLTIPREKIKTKNIDRAENNNNNRNNDNEPRTLPFGRRVA